MIGPFLLFIVFPLLLPECRAPACAELYEFFQASRPLVSNGDVSQLSQHQIPFAYLKSAPGLLTQASPWLVLDKLQPNGLAYHNCSTGAHLDGLDLKSGQPCQIIREPYGPPLIGGKSALMRFDEASSPTANTSAARQHGRELGQTQQSLQSQKFRGLLRVVRDKRMEVQAEERAGQRQSIVWRLSVLQLPRPAPLALSTSQNRTDRCRGCLE